MQQNNKPNARQDITDRMLKVCIEHQKIHGQFIERNFPLTPACPSTLHGI